MALILYVFHDFGLLEALNMARKFNIRRSMHKDMIYGSLMELVKNQRVWHESSVSPEYSHLTDDGKDAIIHVVEELFRGMQTIHNQEVKEEAKRQTLAALK
jgi:acid stress-induced BolA-like protein IbaG/YrbA